MSTGHYKRYNYPPFIEIENEFTGAKIGYTKIPHVTVADDLALPSNLVSDIICMLCFHVLIVMLA